jgi:hypothetical protein
LLHDAKNDLTGAMLLLNRFRSGAEADLAEVERLIREAVLRIDAIPGDFPASLRARRRPNDPSAGVEAAAGIGADADRTGPKASD